LSDHLARHDDAQAELEAAIATKPDYLPALLNLGNLHEDRGNREAGEQAYRRALDVAPGDALALSRLGGVVLSESDQGSELVDVLRAALSVSRPAPERADLGFSLARLLDGRGDYDAAFGACEAANRASRESLAGAGYDRVAHQGFIDRLIAAFPRPAQSADGGSPAIFIVGMFRSGSTLVERILASHSGLVAGGELDLIPALAATIPGYPDSVAAADETTLAAWRRFYADGIAPFSRDGALLTDKRPDNFLHVGLIKTLFPDAKIIHTRRNRLDNLLSLYFLHLDGSMAYALDLQDSAHWYGQYERLMAHWKHLYPDDIFDVDYDTLVSEPRALIGELLQFLCLDWQESVLNFHEGSAAVKTASVWQVREPLHARSSGRWRNYERQLRQALGDLAESD
jgi:tetratricopeptide (TPR) repeat protein